MEEGRIHNQHEFRRVASITTRGRSRWLTEETKWNLLKCGRQEELLWVSVNQGGLERNISTVWKTEGALASARPALTSGPHSVSLCHITILCLFHSIYCCLELSSLFVVFLCIIYFDLF